MRKLHYLFATLAVLLSHAMVFTVGFAYRDILCAIEHAGFSAPAALAFLYAVPFLVGIALCVILALKMRPRA